MSPEDSASSFPEWTPALAAGGKRPAQEDRQGRLIDLTLTLRPGMRGVEFEPRFNFREHGWNACTLHLYSHCGTHMDAPLHAEAGPGSIDEVPLARCMGPAWVVPLDGIGPRALITVASLGAVAARHAPGDSLLLRTGWSAFVEQPRWRDELPRVSLELARWCVEHQVRMLGVEPPSVADVSNREELVAVHQTLLGGGVLIVEGLTNLEALTQDKVFFVALPLKPLRGDGSPVRAFAVLDSGDGIPTAQGTVLLDRRGGIPAAQGQVLEGVAGGRDAALPGTHVGGKDAAPPGTDVGGKDAAVPEHQPSGTDAVLPQTPQDHGTADPDSDPDPDPLARLVFLQHEQVESERNRLPHWHQSQATYFVTFRLADALPEELLDRCRAEREAWLRIHPQPWTEAEETEYHQRFSDRMEDWLDENHGACVLRQSTCRQVTASALRHFHRVRYELHAFVVMPNHLHVLFALVGEHRLPEVLHTWKSYTGTEINRLLGRRGALWMKDYFDRSIRSREHFEKVARYIRKNPEKAGLRAGDFTLWEGDLVADVLDRQGGWSAGLGDWKGDAPAAQGQESRQSQTAMGNVGGKDAALPGA